MRSKAVQAGPLLLVLDRTRDGDVFVSCHATRSDYIVKTFNLYGRHLRQNPESLELLEAFIAAVREQNDENHND